MFNYVIINDVNHLNDTIFFFFFLLFSRIILTESYSPHDVLFKYYTSGAEIPSNFFLMPSNTKYFPHDFNREIKKWITEMPRGATYNAVVSIRYNFKSPVILNYTYLLLNISFH